MCCIFTCVGWMVDLIQRAWTFAMSCCISSAVCFLMMTSSLSGIALGYNYSLAEYIDLKETNVSVYLKRGVFDDEIADDMDWRRAGHMPVDGLINEDNLVTGAPAGDQIADQSGRRRLEDSMYNSGDHNKFEGGLLKLTAKPLDEPITKSSYTPDIEMAEIQGKGYNELNKLKAIQGILNKRRYNFIAATSTTESARRMMAKDPRGPEIPDEVMHPPPPKAESPDAYSLLLNGRRFNPYDPKLYQYLNPARNAVPDQNLGSAVYWSTINPYLPTSPTPLFLYNEIYPVSQPTLPQPIKVDMKGPIIPATPAAERRQFSGPPVLIFTEGRKAETKDKYDEGIKSGDESDRLDQKMREELSRHKGEEYSQKEEDYELDAKGFPVRKKRDIISDSKYFKISPFLSSPVVELSQSPEMFSTETKLAPALFGKLISTLIQ